MGFDIAFDRLLKNEGGYTFNPKDPGGETNWGICKRSYTKLDIKGLTREQAKEIYRNDFWIRGQMEAFNFAISFQVFDAAVNHGIETAIRLLQRSVGCADDGHIGPITKATVLKMTVTDVLVLFIAERIDFWARLSTWETFGRGWARRAAANLRYAARDA